MYSRAGSVAEAGAEGEIRGTPSLLCIYGVSSSSSLLSSLLDW